MASSRRRPSHTVINRILDTPHCFDFLQAMRALEFTNGLDNSVCPAEGKAQPNYSWSLNLRFVNDARLHYPSAVISKAEKMYDGTVRITVAGIGLLGALGVLPYSYTTHSMKRIGYDNSALIAFFDIFQHRVVEFFYGASSKYRLAIDFERRERGGGDKFGRVLRSLVGIEGVNLRNRLALPDDAILYHAGLLALGPRSADGLEALLRSELRYPVTVIQFVGRWMTIEVEEQTRLGASGQSNNQYCELGISTVIGERVWRGQHSIRIVVGPVDHNEIAALLPGGQQHLLLCDIVRFYCGMEYEFDIQLAIRAEAVPMARLALGDSPPPSIGRLGQTAWILTGASLVDREEAIFQSFSDE